VALFGLLMPVADLGLAYSEQIQADTKTANGG
jgi:hypothetical protein